MTHDDARGLLGRMLRAAIGAADPARVLAAHLPEEPRGRCIVVGGGKSAASMAQAVERAWPDVDLSGVVVTRYGHAVPTGRITLREASQPVPDAAARAATVELMSAVAEAGPDDLVLAHHRDGWRQASRQGWTQYRVPALSRALAGRSQRDLGDRGRHRRDRWDRDRCRCDHRSRFSGRCSPPRHRCALQARDARQLYGVRETRQSSYNGANVDQCE